MPEYTTSQSAAIGFSGKRLLVSAAAGSGKTRVLVGRVLDRIEKERLDIDDFLIITFTRAAAAELRDRFSLELGKLSASNGDHHIRRQLSSSKENITTIDAFCSALVREYSHLTDISGRRIVSDGELPKLRERARSAALDRIYSSDDPDLSEALSAFSYGRADKKFADSMEKVYDQTREHPFPDIWKKSVIDLYSSDNFAATPFGVELHAAAIRVLTVAKNYASVNISIAKDDDELYGAYGPALEDDFNRISLAITALGIGEYTRAAKLVSEKEKLGRLLGRKYDPLKDLVQGLRKKMDDLCERASKLIVDPEIGTRELALQLPAIRGLFLAAEIFGEELKRVKSLRHVAEFQDYAHAAIELLADVQPDGSCHPSAIAHAVSSRFKEVLVDEFQDTNELQTMICDLLTAEDGHKLFMVGDVKQSIYRFRLARPDIFLSRYNGYPPIEDEKDDAVLCLSENFRSRKEVIGPINYFFRRTMVGGISEINYDKGQYLYPGRQDDAQRDDCLTEFCILNASDAFDEDDNASVDDRMSLEAQYVAERITDMLRDGFPVPDGNGGERPLRPNDIAVLLRSPKKRSWMYRQALENMGLECCCDDTAGTTAELMTLLSVLTAIDNPYLDVPLAGAMLSPVFGFSHDELALIRAYSPTTPTIFDSVLYAAHNGSERAKAFVERLENLRRAAGSMTPDKLLLKLYAETGLVGIYSAPAGGEARRERLNQVYLAARNYSRESRYRLHGFIEYLEGMIERGQFDSDPSYGDGVRIMSIHKSKGLEFPVVFCSALGSKINYDSTNGDMLVHSELGPAFKLFDHTNRYVYPSGAWSAVCERIRCETVAEELRMLYVAMTRAREKLVITCVLPDVERTLTSILRVGWLGESSLFAAQSLANILIPLAAEHPDGTAIRAISGNSAVVPLEPEDGRMIVHVIGLTHGNEAAPTEQMPDIVPPTPDEAVYNELRSNLSYEYPHPRLFELPSKLTATQLKGLRTGDEDDPEIGLNENGDPDEDASEAKHHREFTFRSRRPRFISESTVLTPTERGTALHTAMQFADYSNCTTEADALMEIDRLLHKRYLTQAQADAVKKEIYKVCTFATGDLCRRAMASPNLHREFKFSILDDANRYFPDAPENKKVLLQGVCDMFFEEDGGLTVVDYKSDRVSAATEHSRAEEYAPQLDAYARALGRIFGAEVKRKVIYFFATGHEVELK